MTIASNIRRAGPFATNGVDTVFPFAFKVFSATDVSVVLSADGVDIELANGADYTVTLNPDQDNAPGGTVTTAVAQDDVELTIISNAEIAQPTEFTNQGGFYPNVLNTALDRLTIFDQQIAEKLTRVPLLPQGDRPVGNYPVILPDGSFGFSAGTGSDPALRGDLGGSGAGKGAALVGWIRNAVGAVGSSIADYFEDQWSVMQFIPLTERVKIRLGTSTADVASYLQAAIDAANGAYLGGTYGGGGATLRVPAGQYISTGVIMKRGVRLVGDGPSRTIIKLTGNNSVGFATPARASQVSADSVSYGEISGMSLAVADAAPSGQVHIDMTGMVRWAYRDLYVEFCGGCNGVSLTGATLAGPGGPSQWYNDFFHCFFEKRASTPSGGVAVVAGDTDSAKEQATTWRFFGGAVKGPANGTGISFQGATGCQIEGVTFEGLTTAIQVGSASGTRQCYGNIISNCYWEGNTTNVDIKALAEDTQILGGRWTGGVFTDAGLRTQMDIPNIYKRYVNSTNSVYEINIQNGANRRPKFKGSTVPGFDLEDSSGNAPTIAGGVSALGVANGAFRFFSGNGLTGECARFGSSLWSPVTNGTANLGSATAQFNNLYIDSGVFHSGTKVLGAQQAAIADDASGAANQTTVNAVLAALRAHGIIAT